MEIKDEWKGTEISMKVIGIDLAGPANHKDTVMSVFQADGDLLIFEKVIEHASDEKIFTTIQAIAANEDVGDRNRCTIILSGWRWRSTTG